MTMTLNHLATIWIFPLLLLSSCASSTEQPATRPAPPVAEEMKLPQLSHAQVMERFRSRATPDELSEFDKLSISVDESSRNRALEMVLFKLNDEELFDIGITQLHDPGHTDWGIAWTDDSGKVDAAFSAVLAPVHVSYFGSCDLGACGWYVPREEFFIARRALIESPAVRVLGMKIVKPEFDLK